ncbi:tRNA pseudouridine(55) synthase TruB [Calorimonas adulescens]|uniref:tRNA pseudouridine(55) synthase TruB n=1 Tax=Calorimonas adulescens TaxID=2606906 RepID=UPI001396B771|nr:tRNA pseudouridine(55) synthase TruB [Calorimonas adulescens]
MNGILNVYKPEGVSSNYVVQKIKKMFKLAKVGHGGTLDPFASGILPIFVNKATRLNNYIHSFDKEYVACIELGTATDTADYTGKVVKRMSVPDISEEKIKESLKNFVGQIEQVPPAYSAKKLNGIRAYDLARKGVHFSLVPIKVIIYSCDLLYYEGDKIYIRVKCGSGTYIRTLCEDIACSLGTVGYVSYLERIRYGPLEKSNAIAFDDLFSKIEINISDQLLPLDFLLHNFPWVVIKGSALKTVLNGGMLSEDQIEFFSIPINVESFVRVYSIDRKFIGIGKFNGNKLKISLFLQ